MLLFLISVCFSVLALAKSSQFCQFHSVSTFLGSTSCQISYQECGEYRQFKNCLLSNNGSDLTEIECLSSCCSMNSGMISSPQFDVCLKENSRDLNQDQIEILLIVGGCFFPFLFIAVVCCCIYAKSKKKISILANKEKKQTSENNPQMNKNQQISLQMIFVASKNEIEHQNHVYGLQLKLQDEELNKICHICLQNKIDCITSCNHHFHFRCLKQWCKKSLESNRCPIIEGHEQKSDSSEGSQESPRHQIKLRKSISDQKNIQMNHNFQKVFVYCCSCNYIKKVLKWDKFLEQKQNECTRYSTCSKSGS